MFAFLSACEKALLSQALVRGFCEPVVPPPSLTCISKPICFFLSSCLLSHYSFSHYDIEAAFDRFVVCLGSLCNSLTCLSASMFTCFSRRLRVRGEKGTNHNLICRFLKIIWHVLSAIADQLCLCIFAESFLIINISTLGTIINALPPFFYIFFSLIVQNKNPLLFLKFFYLSPHPACSWSDSKTSAMRAVSISVWKSGKIRKSALSRNAVYLFFQQ